MNVPSALGEFLRRHVPRPPEWQPASEERLRLAAADGALSLGPAPASGVSFGRPPLSRDDRGAGRYLRVIDATGVRYVREAPLPARRVGIPVVQAPPAGEYRHRRCRCGGGKAVGPRENLTTDYLPLSDTPDRRRGMFAYLVAKCRKEGLISDRIAALYLRCPVEELARRLDSLISLYE